MAAAPLAAEKQVFDGQYDWSNGGKDTLTATFTPQDDESFKVTFKFRWSGKNNTWKGKASGNLSGGPVSGSVTAPGGRDWVFRGEIKEGVMTAEHFEIRSGSEVSTGTFEIRLK